MHLFLAHPSDIHDSSLILTGEEHHHGTRVLRLRLGEELYVADGRGWRYRCRVTEVTRDQILCCIDDREETDPPSGLVLVCGILKNPAKMDWIVEKAVELGVGAVRPCRTERCVAQRVRTDRLNELARAAMKQSLRAFLPAVHEASPLEEVWDAYRSAEHLCFHESADEDVTIDWLQSHPRQDSRPRVLWIGPEGGFSDDEVATLRARGAWILRLGSRRLRSETAAITALACLTLGGSHVL